jgi:hypothetical protein
MGLVPYYFALGRINEIKWGITPQEWLESHWYIQFNDMILAEPSSTFFVFALGFIILLVSLKFIRNINNQKSRLWFSLSMLSWSLSTFSAGVSYQIFSYELKCAGQSVCLWTTPWEIVYLILYVLSVKFLVVGVSVCCGEGKFRHILKRYALMASLLYLIIITIGVMVPDQFLISFENMVLFLVPSYFMMFGLNLVNYLKTKQALDLRLMKAWVGMLLITISYFGFYLSGISTILWQQGIWFNANDVLHILLIIWALYILKYVEPLVKDKN